MMTGTSSYKYFTATGLIYNGSTEVYSISLTGGSDAASLTVRDGATGMTICVLKAAANTTEQYSFPKPLYVFNGIYATITGTAASGFVSSDGLYASTSSSTSTTTTSSSTSTTSTSTTTTSTSTTTTSTSTTSTSTTTTSTTLDADP